VRRFLASGQRSVFSPRGSVPIEPGEYDQAVQPIVNIVTVADVVEYEN
tara:strand:- start:204970 stop:205113 length:144 start_codon:yes stop_codon:yes gene_type:complete